MKARRFVLGFAVLLIACACPWDDELREYLNAHFWSPFAKHAASFEKPNVRRMNAPYAGMRAVEGKAPLAQLRKAYQDLPQLLPYSPDPPAPLDVSRIEPALAAARADRSL